MGPLAPHPSETRQPGPPSEGDNHHVDSAAPAPLAPCWPSRSCRLSSPWARRASAWVCGRPATDQRFGLASIRLRFTTRLVDPACLEFHLRLDGLSCRCGSHRPDPPCCRWLEKLPLKKPAVRLLYWTASGRRFRPQPVPFWPARPAVSCWPSNHLDPTTLLLAIWGGERRATAANFR